MSRSLAPTLPFRVALYAVALLLALVLARVSGGLAVASGPGSAAAVQDHEPVNPAENR